ncbi:MAG: hypothetical protein NTX22_07435 [Ignavibacteriales bacterium]|nr:hypothetical protein [Ignavibacteriales bacterium]
MRRICFAILILGILIVFAVPLKAQVSFNLGFNLGIQPAWGPTGYDYVEYYYLPDIEVYYNVPQHRYYYNDGGRWINRSSLPSRFRSYDYYNSYKVVVNEREPWRNHDNYREKYSSFKGRHDQQPIRDSRDSKYFANKNHPEHNQWVKQQKHDNGNRDGWNKGNNDNERNKANKQNNKRDRKENGKKKR